MPNLEVVIARLIFAENVFFASEQLNIKRNDAKNVCCAKLFMCKEGILRAFQLLDTPPLKTLYFRNQIFGILLLSVSPIPLLS